ncbi:MAG: class I SAM-dependent methyltransferase [Lachnospiraceae bacterium]|nr:class I SAM-dependent methyltransferase [Lachnospiraceae bacterium]
MIEKIGKVTIDDTHYPGEDFYCDGAVEDEILKIVRENAPSAYGRIIEERKNWPILYHLSHLRENIVNWIPVGKTDKVLEVGSGCGAITGALSAKAGSVTCVELSKKRSLINAYRHLDCENVTIKLGNFQEIEPELACDYDYIFLIGVFEYAQSYIGGEKPFETFLAIMKEHLAPGGRLVIAIENRFGLKYWAGCKEDHLGTYFDGIEGYPRGGGVRTFTRRGLEEICRANGITEYSFYYPYPDYKFMTCVYSDERLPKAGELSDNMRNFDRDRLLLFDEKNVFDSLIGEEMFPQFSNSYVLVIGEPLPVTYTRFSNDRAPEYAIRTEIRKTKEVGGNQGKAGDEAAGLEVRKIPLTEEAKAHVRKLEETYHTLEEMYRGSGLLVNRCRMDGDEAVFEYLPGKTLEELLDGCLERGDTAGFRRLFDRYCKYVRYPKNAPICDYDLIFPNLIIQDDKWHLIDYEWISDGQVSPQELILRALYCYGIGADKRKQTSLALIGEIMEESGGGETGSGTERAASSEEMRWEEAFLEEIVRKEKAFQKRSTGNRMSMVEIRNEIACPIVPVAELSHRYMEEETRNRVQIYEDCGAGFSEETSYFLPQSCRDRKPFTIELETGAKCRSLRIDPALDYCVVRAISLQIDGTERSLCEKDILLNGDLISDDTVVFATQDPNLTICGLDSRKDVEERGHRVHAELEVTRLSYDVAKSLAKQERKADGQGIFSALFRK